jgi:hypothetical protein
MAKAAYHVGKPPYQMEPRLNENGTGIEDVHVIPYVIDSGPAKGHKGQVKVPHAEFNVDTTRAMIEEQVDTHHDIAGLKSPA